MKTAERKQCVYLLGLALVLRLIHLSTFASNPITYYPGPDEAFYLAFGADVAAGGLGLSGDFAFMDPLFGYFLGLLFYFTGENLFALYLVQILIDVLTVWMIYLAGRHCWGHRAGLLGGYSYALAATAIFFTTTALKPTLAALFVSCWVMTTLRINEERGAVRGLYYGLLLGLGVALRSNFLLLAAAGLCLSVFWIRPGVAGKLHFGSRHIAIGLGFLLVLAVLAGRNHHISDEWKFLPANGGVVLHQLYNRDNLQALEFHPEFVSYGSPVSILTGYQSEAERRIQRDISVYEMSGYWRDQARDFVAENPGVAISNILRKAIEFVAYSEISNNRSFNLEREFSVVLNILPSSFGVLVALGLPGLMLIGLRNKRNLVVCLIPLAIVFATFVIFIAASRFRMHGLPVLAVGTGVSLAAISDSDFSAMRKRILIFCASALFMLSFVATFYTRTEAERSLSLAWGFVKMGSPEAAYTLIIENQKKGALSPSELDLLGYISLEQGDNNSAIDYYSKAAGQSPTRHISQYNLSIAYSRSGQFLAALRSINAAMVHAYSPEYLYQKAQVFEQMGATEKAAVSYQEIVSMPRGAQQSKVYKQRAVEALLNLRSDGQP
ncbi:MAG: glycosyltransferase family 39 protein [Halioglobus sp.]